jgi:hypothetical protein
MHTFSRSEYQVIWMIGVLERLASLSLISEPPNKLSADALDIFIELDSENVRFNLFDSDKEILALFDCMVQSDFPDTPKDVIKGIGEYILDYKNKRYTLVRHCLKEQYAQALI